MRRRWITIISFSLPHEAQIAKGRLESEGIKTILKDELTTQVNHLYSNAMGGVKILVHENDIKKAYEILVDGGFISESEQDRIHRIVSNFNGRNCPFCDSVNILPKRKPTLISILCTFLFWVPLPIFKKQYHCFNCDKEWKI